MSDDTGLMLQVFQQSCSNFDWVLNDLHTKLVTEIESQPTLRDMFAKAIIQGFSANPNVDIYDISVTEWAYARADAMLAARSKT